MILGAQSSIGKSVIEKLIPLDVRITGTSRSKAPSHISSETLSWQYLDLGDFNSSSNFISSAKNQKFHIILNLIGKLSNLDRNANPKDLSLYFQTYISNQTILIRELLETRHGHPKLFINFSSRAVTYGSYDLYYSAAKSAIHGLTRSLAKLHKDCEFINLIPGLIKGSSMYLSMPEEVQKDHEHRAGGQLIVLDEIGEFVVNLIRQKTGETITNPGTCVDIFVGPQYE
jgi:NADP-dependent 3-hydroxy acid dehydrogenase YdfG